MVAAKVPFSLWWAVEVSNLRPQQCECQLAASSMGLSLGSDAARTSGNGTREQQIAPDLHRLESLALPSERLTLIPTNRSPACRSSD